MRGPRVTGNPAAAGSPGPAGDPAAGNPVPAADPEAGNLAAAAGNGTRAVVTPRGQPAAGGGLPPREGGPPPPRRPPRLAGDRLPLACGCRPPAPRARLLAAAARARP